MDANGGRIAAEISSKPGVLFSVMVCVSGLIMHSPSEGEDSL